ncbi:MAG TPA: hypothetical protein VNO32_43000, partial [Candidatus Acidoferrum sp.]|nr:hypothetical protein [Candidatus Acidoferrum sp.]
QTTTFLSKAIAANERFMQTLEKEGVKSFPARPSLSDVARFQFFHNAPGRKFGVWIVRQGDLHFVLPFVTGPKAATSDYEPVPDGFPGLAVPVEKLYPCLVPFLELEDGRTIAAVDGADDIDPAADGKSVSAFWKRWVVVGAKAGVFVDPGLVSEVTWSLRGNTLQTTESLTASQSLGVRRLWFAIPSRYDHLETSYLQSTRLDRLISEGKSLEIRVENSNLLLNISAYAAGNDPLGRGDRGPLPMHLIFQAENFSLTPAKPTYWELSLTPH